MDREKFRLDGYIVLITGSSSGIGKETARDLALRGATIIMANRDLKKSERVVAQLRLEEGEDKLPEDRFKIRRLDLVDFESVRAFAKTVCKEFPVIDILINNAGYAYYGGTQQFTKDGFEITFQTNHLGHFLLTSLIINNVLASERGPKIINISSVAHAGAEMDWNDLNGCNNYGGFKAYAQSKLANVLFTKQLNELYRGRLNTYAVHPGLIATDIVRNDSFLYFGVKWFSWIPILINERQGKLLSVSTWSRLSAVSIWVLDIRIMGVLILYSLMEGYHHSFLY